MQLCQSCKSQRIMFIGAKSSDGNGGNIRNKEFSGYVPRDLNIGGGDYIEISFCLDCGQMQGEWPAPEHEIEQQECEDSSEYDINDTEVFDVD